jgi:hypothetical protein
VDAIDKLLRDVLAGESEDRADLTRIVRVSSCFESAVGHVRTVFPEWRHGQAYCNVLRVARPDLYLELVGTVADPFYRDDRIQAFREWLAARMSWV